MLYKYKIMAHSLNFYILSNKSGSKMKAIINKLIFLGLLIFLSSCSSSLFMLSPDEDSKLEMGRKVITKEDSKVFSSLAFEGQYGKEMGFFLLANNKNEETIIVDPAEIRINYYDKHKNQIHGQTVYAINPEFKIAQMEEAIDDRETSHKVNTGLNVAFALISTIVDLSDDEDNDAEEVAENVMIFTGNQIGEEVSYDNDMDNYESEKDFWENGVLRITELYQDESVEGRFFIPLNEDASYIKIHVPLGEVTHSYKFRQVEK